VLFVRSTRLRNTIAASRYAWRSCCQSTAILD
jgi:hypothetical protein